MLAIGCNLGGFMGGSDDEATKESSDPAKKTEAVPSGEVVKVGIPECDELATYINDNSEEIEGSIVARGIVYLYKNMILDSIREGIEKMDDEQKAKLGGTCAKSLEDLKKSLKR